MARGAAALGHVVRIRLLRRLCALGTASYVDLCRASGQSSGPLYHHVQALKLAGFVTASERNVYRVTAVGRRAWTIWSRFAASLKG